MSVGVRRLVPLLAPLTALAIVPVTAPAAAAAPKLRLGVRGAVPIGRAQVVLDGQGWQVTGAVSQYAPGQSVIVTFRRAGHHLSTVTAPIRSDRRGGFFSVPFHLSRPGRVRVYVTHVATPELAGFGGALQVDVIAAGASFGSSGLRVAYLQRRLRTLGYAVPFSGRFDDATARAVIAYRKVNGMARNDVANHRIFAQLERAVGAFRAKYPGHGRHLEADLSKQVLALINPGGRVYRVYHVSSGKPSTPTVLGSFYVYSKTPGYNSLGMLNSNYFIEGYAVHGYHDVPTYAASHGCIRAPIPDAGYLYSWIQYGTRVDVYQRGKRPGSVRVRPHPGP
jgi:lipoprotein-anchoring transpeptidase ErfK/SrfK